MGAPHALLSVKMCGLSSVFAAAWCTRSVPVLVSVKISSVFEKQKQEKERPRAAFFRALRSRTSRSPIHKLQTLDDREIVDEHEDVRSVVETFFERLFQGCHASDPDPSERLPSRADAPRCLAAAHSYSVVR